MSSFYLISIIDRNLNLIFRILDENDTDGNNLWNNSMVYYSGYTYESLEPLMEKLCALIASADVSKFQVNFHKQL